jgi:excisionase family DNA binding protein
VAGLLKAMQQQVSTIQPRYLSMKDAATYTGLTTRTLHKAVANNSVRSFLNGRKRLILRESLDAWIEGAGASRQSAQSRSLPRDPASDSLKRLALELRLHLSEVERLASLIIEQIGRKY